MNIRRLFQFKSIHSHIAIAFSVLILCTTAILSYSSYRLSVDAVTDNSLTNTTELIQQVKHNIQNYIENMENISTLAINNADLREYLSNDPLERQGNKVLESRVNVFFNSIVTSRNDIASIMFLGPNDVKISDRPYAEFKESAQLTAQDWYANALKAQGSIQISSSHVQHIFQNEYRWVVSISRQLIDSKSNVDNGVLLVDLNYNVIEDLCKRIQLGNKGYVFILDPKGDMIYHPQQQIIYTKLKSEDITTILNSEDGTVRMGKENEGKIYTVSTTAFGWKVVGVTYPDELIGNKREMQITSALWGLLSLCVALSISILLAYRITKPIKNLDARMKEVETGDFNVRVDLNGPHEIGKLVRTFNLMIEKIKMLMSQIVQEQEMKRISEIKALQAQIQPHFLYNTLDSIIWMAEMGKMESVVTMTSALSKLLRSSISKGEELVPIQVELEHIENYLTIQAFRYRNKFTYSIEVDQGLLSNKILKIILQPLVENAIYHGIKQKAELGHIQITGKKENGIIELKVIDDGVGMEPEKVKSMLAKSRLTPEGKGVGLQNVNHRIQLYFGESYGLEFDSEPEEGTAVTVRIPELE
jgi:two-component system sensor histidine kinase YesM